MSLFYGLMTGIIFGFLLQKAQVLRYDKQVGALRLLDMTILKFMLSAIGVAAIGIYLFKDLGLIKLSIKSTSITNSFSDASTPVNPKRFTLPCRTWSMRTATPLGTTFW